VRARSVAESALHVACRSVGLGTSGVRRLKGHSASVHLLPGPGVVVRVSPSATNPQAARRAVAVTSWLASTGFPTVVPAPGIPQPVEAHGRVVTFWTFVEPPPASHAPDVTDLGRLLRRLHAMPGPPPVDLPAFRPLTDLTARLDLARSLDRDMRAWLLERAAHLVETYAGLDSPLGAGHVHGDAYPGNLLGARGDAVLGDWEETAWGPRELDLANTYQGVRFGRSPAELDAFARAYGHDPRDWDGLDVLTEIRDLHTLGSYITRADTGDAEAEVELRLRVGSLRRSDAAARWTAA
jgi:Ser/Thr protein kinase RdoA (MazF antagonist)